VFAGAIGDSVQLSSLRHITDYKHVLTALLRD
jgi:hypothetical protein